MIGSRTYTINPSASSISLGSGRIEWNLENFRIRLYAKDGSHWIKIRDNKVFIYEWKEYRIRVHPIEEFERIRVSFGDDEAEKDEEFWKYTFKNYIGETKLRIYYDNLPVIESDMVVISPKFIHLGDREDIDNYLNFVESVTSELIRHSLELPFDIKAPTGFRIEESTKPINLLFAYHFFKSKKERIISAYEHILSAPHRKLEEVEEWVNLAKVATVDEDLIVNLVSKPELWRRSKHPLSEKTKGFIPEKFHQWEKYESLDTPENRFAKHFLERMSFWLEEVSECIRGIGYNVLTLKELEDLQSYLEAVLNDPIWSDVGDFRLFPFQSQVLLKKDGYRELLELWKLFNAYVPIFSEINEAIANKRVDKLYEYWCFFELIKKLEKISRGLKSIEVKYGNAVGIEEGKTVARFEDDFELIYNKKFSRREKGSYSVSLKPDYTLLKDGDIVAVFDAKFRFEDRFTQLRLGDLEGEIERVRDSGNLELLAKLEDIFKMHTYKDALSANAAVILYPGNVNRFFMVDTGLIENVAVEDILKLILEHDLKGIGFLSFVPSKNRGGERV